MPDKLMSKYLIIIVISVFMTACVKTGIKEKMPEEEEAALYRNLGERYLEMGRLKEAKNNLEKAEKISSNADIHNALGALNERLGLFTEAKSEYQQAIALDVNNVGAKNNYGRFLCERGHYKEGMALLNDALVIPLNNRKWLSYTNIGRCHLEANKQDLAEANLRKALQLNQNFPSALFEMQKISYHSGKYLSARGFLERYLSVSKHNAGTLWYAVQTERALGNKRFVESYKEKLNRLFPTSKEAQQIFLKTN